MFVIMEDIMKRPVYAQNVSKVHTLLKSLPCKEFKLKGNLL